MIKLRIVSFVLVLDLCLGVPHDIRHFEDEEIDERIINGKTAKVGQFPYQASLWLHGTHYCGGSIISADWILTAAHCLSGSGVGSLAVVVGHVATNGNNGKTYKVSQAIIHERYGTPNKLSNDIGVVRVASKISFNNVIKKVPLASQPPQTGSRCVISGWGTTIGGSNSPPRELQFTEVDLPSMQQCKSLFDPIVVEDTVICAKNAEDRRICTGDSGGPLVCSGVQYGVVSFVKRNCPPGSPGGYANVYSYRQWISSKTGV